MESSQPAQLRPRKRSYAVFLEDSVTAATKHKSLSTLVTDWLDGFRNARHYKFESDLGLGLNTYRRTELALPMEQQRDVQDFDMPPTSPQSGPVRGEVQVDLEMEQQTQASQDTSARSSNKSRSLVEDPLYRSVNLAANNIYLRSRRESYPEHIGRLVAHIGRDRESPEPSTDDILQDEELEWLQIGSNEPDVEDYFKGNIFPNIKASEPLQRNDRLPMSRRAVPHTSSAQFRLSTPQPDLLFGYKRSTAFSSVGQTQLLSMGNEMVANSMGLIYPFFVVELKADGPSGAGSLWVATNQCLNGSAACVNIAEQLKNRLSGCGGNRVSELDTSAFSVAMNGTEARLYITWKQDDLHYFMKIVQIFLLQKPEDFLHFRKYTRNIIDWGKGQRLNLIQESIGALLEDSMTPTAGTTRSGLAASSGSGSRSRGSRLGGGRLGKRARS